MRSASEIILGFGGPTKLAGRLGIGITRVSNWGSRDNKIPGDWHLVLMRLARKGGASEKDVALLGEELEALSLTSRGNGAGGNDIS